MCLAVPAEVVRMVDGMATCRLDDSQTTIQASLMLLPEPPVLGDYIVVHAGFALQVLDRAEAAQTLRLLRDPAKAADAPA